MARIRTIKPEFFTSEDIVSVSPMARLLYIACWCEADRDGRMEWRPGTMKLRYFPGDDCDVGELSRELFDRGMLVRYEVDGREYTEIPSFAKHQIINNRESASQIPSRVGHASGTRKSRVSGEGRKEGKGGRVVPFNGTPQELDDGIRREGTGDDGFCEDEGTPAASLPLIDGSLYDVFDAKVEEWSRAFPAVDVLQSLQAMIAWLNANPKNRKTRSGVDRFIVHWLSKEQNRAARAPGGTQEDKPWAGAI